MAGIPPAKPAKPGQSADGPAAVEAFIGGLAEPLRSEVQLLRQALLDSDAAIGEGIRWNAPSFRTGAQARPGSGLRSHSGTQGYFATMHLRGKPGLALVLHVGAKARQTGIGADTIADPQGLLQWLAKDRAIIRFSHAADLNARRPALQAIVKQWMQHAD